jgi:NADPH-dependent F420 reductase
MQEKGIGMERIAIVGGTGALGGGLAMRCARAGLSVAIGSRDPARAEAAAREIAVQTGNPAITGHDNAGAAALGDIVFVTVPFASQAATLASIRPVCAGRIVVDTTVPLVPPKVARVQLPAEGSAAAVAAAALGPEVRLVTGLHNISAAKLGQEGDPGCDVLVFGDDVEAREAVVGLAGRIGLRAFHAGPLDNSVAAEAMTSVLISINRRYKVADGAGLRITGIA